MRAFVALEVPRRFGDEVAELARQLSARVEGCFMARSSYHVTLAFLGEIDEAAAEHAVAAVAAACRGHLPPLLAPDALGVFGGRRDATLWLGLADNPELNAIAGSVREGLRAAGLAFDGKPFRAHITLVRRARIPAGTLSGLVFPGTATAGCLTLFKSAPTSAGARYKELFTCNLKGSDPGHAGGGAT